ncbi:MAG TPA: UTP--glucose-1-phosphate uridylyltransferase [Solirubrobacteraceae bacterium]|nr:UTP--glucose-1-phosphate uridylyltransferase [Solirubrobacteraceae bacterium]
MSVEGLRAGTEKMRAAGLPEVAIETFAHYYRALEAGETGLIAEAEIEPAADVAALDDLAEPAGRDLLDAAVVLKLNGGLGTSMGMTRAKSLIEAKDGHTFLDLIARQVLALRAATGARLPLVLMDSFATREDSLAALAAHERIASDLPADFLQGMEPKLSASDLTPVAWPADPALEWCPPGHGDLYTALQTSGLLERMLAAGYRWAFVSNSDNLGAVLDARILAWMAAEGAPFVMEVTRRTPADRKGGHIARRRSDGSLLLRESAQTPEQDLPALQDIDRHRWVNTNNLWLDLRALAAELERRGGVLGLPLIRNRKTVDPADPSSPAVLQIETAMGAALGVIDGARVVAVPRTRFAPVKTTDDLLVLRSDAYVIGEGAVVEPAPGRAEPPFVALDPARFRLVADFEQRVAGGVPSLRECDRLVVRGDVWFGPGVVVRGDVEVDAGDGTLRLSDTILDGQPA